MAIVVVVDDEKMPREEIIKKLSEMIDKDYLQDVIDSAIGKAFTGTAYIDQKYDDW